jgi:hypothetical protein
MATNGSANTGGGGGGVASARLGGTGGSGIVILKYLVPVGTTVTHIYKGSGSWVAPEGVTAIDWLVVAGGGGGGDNRGGGGGAGGYRTGTGLSVTAGTTYTLTVGAGGGGASSGPGDRGGSGTTLLSLVRLLRKTLRVLELTHLKPMVAVVVAVLVLVMEAGVEEMVAAQAALAS